MDERCLPAGRDIVLHTCCAPCLIYPLDVLKENGFNVTGVFYNPNIHPLVEYSERKNAVEMLSLQIEMLYPDYNPADFFRAVNLSEDFPGRCAICWRERLRKTAKFARERNAGYFTTTLLVSPYQDHGLLQKIGNDIAREEGVRFFYSDFRKGFRKAHEEARGKGIYMQKYCGCIYSELERRKKKKNE